MGYLPGARLSFGEHVGLDAVVQALDKLAERVHAGLAEQRRAGRGRYRLRKHAHELFHFFDFFPFFNLYVHVNVTFFTTNQKLLQRDSVCYAWKNAPPSAGLPLRSAMLGCGMLFMKASIEFCRMQSGCTVAKSAGHADPY